VRQVIAWLLNAKFNHGVAGVILDKRGRVLLLKHRFWKDQRWGLPGGHARHGETLEATLRRELLEETGLEVRPGKLLEVGVGKRSVEFVLQAECDGEPEVRSVEIMEAGFWDRGELPENMLPSHRKIVEKHMEERLKYEG